jgi:hypothetical protein
LVGIAADGRPATATPASKPLQNSRRFIDLDRRIKIVFSRDIKPSSFGFGRAIIVAIIFTKCQNYHRNLLYYMQAVWYYPLSRDV